jgi:zinc metalloprotease ZmpA
MKKILVAAAMTGCLTISTLNAGTWTATAAPAKGKQQAIAWAQQNVTAHASKIGLAKGQSVQVLDTIVDSDGSSHVRFQRTYRGVEVIGGDFVVHQGKRGAYRALSGAKISPVAGQVKPKVGAKHAANTAARSVGFRPTSAKPELKILAVGRTPTLTWRVNVEGRRADSSPAGQYVFVSAHTGKVIDSWASEVNVTGSGNSLFVGTVPVETTQQGASYVMIDPTRGNNATHNGPYASSAPVFSDSDNTWGNGSTSNTKTAGVDAHFGIATTWDFYKTKFGRNGIANNGVGAKSYVHDGTYVNASWSDSCFCMKYGDGDATTYFPLVELDIAGHEMTHGVTSRTANLVYRGESGGLNEATSDIMGNSVEFYAGNAGDPGDYVVGEEIFRSYNPAINFIRRMDNPSADGASQNCWTTRTRRIDVHYSSGPANHFFYLLSEGSGAKTINGIAHNSTTCNGSTITGIGRDKAAAIWYRALTVYMTSSTIYSGARVATINAATDLYGSSSTEVATVRAAWSAVSVN